MEYKVTLTKSEGIQELAKSLIEAQAEIKAVTFDMENSYIGYKYASLGAIIEGTRHVLAKHGLAILQFPCGSEGSVGVDTILLHNSGQFIEQHIEVPVGEKKGLTLAQVAGMNITYLRRYAWSSVLGLYTEDDTDGQGEVPTHEIVKVNKEVAKVMNERVWSLDALEAVVKADIGVPDHESAKAILDLSVLSDSAPLKTVQSWLTHFAKSKADYPLGCSYDANKAYAQAKAKASK